MNVDHVCDGEPEVSCNKCLLRRERAENAKLRSEIEALKDDKALLTGQLQQSRKHVSDADLQVDKIRNVNHDLADMVRCLEWTDPEGEIASHCPWCEAQKPNHSNPCKLKLLIDQGYIPNKARS